MTNRIFLARTAEASGDILTPKGRQALSRVHTLLENRNFRPKAYFSAPDAPSVSSIRCLAGKIEPTLLADLHNRGKNFMGAQDEEETMTLDRIVRLLFDAAKTADVIAVGRDWVPGILSIKLRDMQGDQHAWLRLEGAGLFEGHGVLLTGPKFELLPG